MQAVEEAAGVFRIPVFTPFDTEPTNAYVLRGERVGLFDTGLNHPRARADLFSGLAGLGVAPDDVDTLFVSHAHVDHHGLAHEFRGSTVVAGGADVWKLRDFHAHMEAYAAAVARLLPRWGVPASLVAALEAPLRSLLEAGASVSWAVPLDPASPVEGFGRPLRVLDLPGHTEGGVGLFREHDGVLLAGDHLLEHITPNPGLFTSREPVGSGLGEYVASLGRLEELAPALVLPGHGRPFARVRERVRAIVAHHEERASHVEAAAGSGRTVFELAGALFPGVDAFNMFLAMVEVFGHAELLRGAGRLEAAGTGDAVPGDVDRPVVYVRAART